MSVEKAKSGGDGMKQLDILDVLEEQGVQLERARAVLHEASRHTETVSVDPQISILTHVVDDYLINVKREIDNAVGVLYKQQRAQEAEESPKTDEARAAYVLSDAIFDMNSYIERAELALQEPIEDYFGRYNTSNDEDKVSIIFDYDRQGVFCNIAADYLFKAGKTLESLSELALKGVDIANKEREDKTV